MPTPVANLVSGILVTLVVFMDTEIRSVMGGRARFFCIVGGQGLVSS